MRLLLARLTFLLPLAALGVASSAHAELVYFDSGRTLSVKAYQIDGDSLVLTLRTGGQVTCARSVITRIEPDEVPYPEPQPEPQVVAAAPVVAPVIDPPVSTYGAIIDRVALEQRVPASLVRAVIQVESNYQPRARSPKGAMGLMQLMPETARLYALADPYDAASNIEAGVKHLRGLLERFELPLALAAYNAGEGAVRRFGGAPPYPETRSYVQRVLKNYLP